MSYATKTQIALIGTGDLSREIIIPGISGLNNAEIKLIAGTDEEKTSDLAALAGAEKYVASDFNPIFSRSDIEVVIIANEGAAHAGLVLEALKSGKHVMVAPPLALTVKDLKNIEFFYAKQDAKGEGAPLLLVMHHQRFSPLLKSLAAYLHKRVSPMMLSWQLNADFMARDSDKRSALEGGRNILEASEIYDTFTALAGAKVRKVEVSSLSGCPEHVDNIDNFISTFAFEDGSLANLVFTTIGNSEYPKNKMTAFCDENVFVFDDFLTLECLGPLHFQKHTEKADYGWDAMFRDFIGSVRNPAAASPVPVEEQLQTARMAIGVEARLSVPILPVSELLELKTETDTDTISSLKAKALSKFKNLVGQN